MQSTSAEYHYVNEEIVNRFWPLAVLFLSIYIPVSFFISNDQLSGWFQLADLLLLLLTLIVYFKTKSLLLMSNILAFLGTPVLIAWLITGGPMGAGLWWSLAYVVWIFFLTPKKWGFFWLILYLTMAINIVVLSSFDKLKIAYNYAELLNLLFAIIFTTALIYFFNQVREYYLNLSNQLALIIESSADAIISEKTDGTILTWNRGAEIILGYSSEEMKGKHISMLSPNQLAIEETVMMEKIINGELIEQYETIRVRKDSTKINVAITLSPMYDKEGNVIAVSSIVRDISKKKEELETLRKYSILESIKSKEMEQLAYITSHDLREPLLTVQNYIKILVEDYGEDMKEGASKYVESITNATGRMDLLIQGLLNYSRLNKGKELQEVNCNVIVNEVLADLDSLIANSGTKIKIENLPTVKAYPLELKLLFQNLIDNAIKFSKKNTAPEINIAASTTNNGWQFEIKDNGIGIRENDKEKIFMIFQRVHNKDEYIGSGIGLAHCKKIAELHQGTIWVESIVGKSSSFYFTIST